MVLFTENCETIVTDDCSNKVGDLLLDDVGCMRLYTDQCSSTWENVVSRTGIDQ